MINLDYLRSAVAICLRDAATVNDERKAARLVMLAARYQELINDLEGAQSIKDDATDARAERVVEPEGRPRG